MGRERVDSYTEAKELSAEHKRVRHGRPGPDIHAGQLPAHGAAGQNMDGVSADYAQLSALNGKLRELREQLQAYRVQAAELGGPLTDGTSPVAVPMRKAFFQRADVEEGVQRTLQDYVEELDSVTTAIENTLSTYSGVDGEAAGRFNRVMDSEGTD
jgi:hypothetical protein